MLVNQLRPEIRERATFVFGDYRKGESDKLILADTQYMTQPPVITFYLKSIEKMNVNEDTLRQIISHEIIHTFGKSEIEAYSRQNSMDFFEKKNIT